MGRRLVAVVLFLGCSSSATEPSEERVLGSIAGYNAEDPRIEITTSGRTATVRVTTYGDGCYRQGPTEVSVEGMQALVTPYDFTARGDVACPRILRSFTHEAIVQFATVGEARIRVRGLRLVLEPGPIHMDTLTVERVVALQ